MQVTEDQLHPFKPRYEVGSKVQTPYGPGIVESYRDSDRIYGIKYIWDDNGSAVGYLNGAVIQPYVHEIKLHTIPVPEHSETSAQPLGAKFPASGSETDVKGWLAGEGFDETLQERLKSYTGARLLSESKEEIVATIGYREAVRLWHLLHQGGENKDSSQGDQKENKNNSGSGSSGSKPESNELDNNEEEDEEEDDEEEEGADHS